MSPETRSRVMSRIPGKWTKPELAVAARLDALGMCYETHARDLPGSPDFVFRTAGVAIFVDGDFWHGWRFAVWKDKLSPAWEVKISGNRRRDARNFRLLRRDGWIVLRVWEHQIKQDLDGFERRLLTVLAKRKDASRG